MKGETSAAAPEKTRPKKRLRAVRQGLVPYGLAAVVVALALWGTYQFVEPAPPDRLTIATGSSEGAYARFADELRAVFARNDITLEIIETAGSVENVARLDAGEVDVAFVQSGIAKPDEHSDIEGLASVYHEPIWVFGRTTERLRRFSDLRGLRVAAGPDGSGTQQVVRELLAANDIPPDALELSTLSGAAAVDALEANELDVVITIASVGAVAVDRLLDMHEVLQMDVARASAYARRYTWMSRQTLPEGVVDLARNVPNESLNVLSTAAMLVAHRDLHPALAELMMQAAHDVFRRDTLFSAAAEFPQRQFLDFPISAEADRYFRDGPPFLQRFLPFWAANLIDRLKVLALPLVALLLPLMRVLPPAYRWSVRKKVFRWYDEVQRIDQSAVDEPSDDNIRRCLERLERIEHDARDIEVPLGYAHELYVLRQHIELLRNQISERTPTPAASMTA